MSAQDLKSQLKSQLAMEYAQQFLEVFISSLLNHSYYDSAHVMGLVFL